MKLRKGKTKNNIESSIDSALLAVEIYNKPRTTFRSGAYITLMVMAWTRLFHAYFNTKGVKYYYKKNGKFELIDGERKSWELSTCIKRFKNLSAPIEKNLDFFIKLRNKIEHRYIDNREIDNLIFGECQALLFNYESLLIDLFGVEYSINEALVYSLQFSRLRTKNQIKANKSALSKDTSELSSFVESFRRELTDEIYNSQEYSIKLIQIPKISNTNRSDVAIEFVKWDELKEEDKSLYEQVAVIIKDKKVKVEGANIKRLKPGEVVDKVKERFTTWEFKMHHHITLYKLFSIRPPNYSEDPFDTITEYCLYDETHNDYVYQDAWVEFLVHFLQSGRFSYEELRNKETIGEKLQIDSYKIE